MVSEEIVGGIGKLDAIPFRGYYNAAADRLLCRTAGDIVQISFPGH